MGRGGGRFAKEGGNPFIPAGCGFGVTSGVRTWRHQSTNHQVYDKGYAQYDNHNVYNYHIYSQFEYGRNHHNDIGNYSYGPDYSSQMYYGNNKHYSKDTNHNNCEYYINVKHDNYHEYNVRHHTNYHIKKSKYGQNNDISSDSPPMKIIETPPYQESEPSSINKSDVSVDVNKKVLSSKN